MPDLKLWHGDEYIGEWRFVDEDWGDWTAEQRQGQWLRTWNGVRQVLRWFAAHNTGTKP